MTEMKMFRMSFLKCIEGHKRKLTEIGILLLTIAGLLIVVIVGCPLYDVFGVCCPCCGVTRAWICFFRGDIADAFRYHGLFPILPLIAALYFLSDRVPPRWSSVINTMLIVAGVIVLGYGALRWCGFVALP